MPLTIFLVALICFLVVLLSVQYSPTYVYRLATMHVADVYDYQFFPNRNINAGNSASKFESRPKAQYIESLFDRRLEVSGFDSFDDWALRSKTTSLIVIQKDKILYEKYFNGFSKESFFHSQSMAKSFISFLIGAAIDEGVIESVDDSIVTYIPSLAIRDSRFHNITIRHLLEMKSGLKYTTHYVPFTNIHSPWHDEAVGYYHNNVRNRLLNEIEVETAPGELFEYNNYNTSFLGMIIENATGKSVSSYLEEKLWLQIMEYDALFSLDSSESGFEYMPSRLIARAIDYARFGMLYLNNGQWQGKQLISASWVKQSLSEIPNSSPDIYPDWFDSDNCERTYYSFHWWGHVNCDGNNQFFATGNLGQNIYVIPDLQIVIVHTGNSLEYYGDRDMWHIAKQLRKDLSN
ncbi:serine hydrolase domain-containing protein [Alteromonas sp. BMJM2]|uniref:serine hydrolase domain-containing protein n=1 Tax=Alteromonas sp. BMJM2 TaxID=2954241 RepID=UPI0022B3F254|nr:serine hydrolase [Alteromonas sp. BMJM2]